MHRNKSVQTHQFAMIPRADIPRASFKMEKVIKTAFDGGYLVPCFCEEVLPGDTFNVRMTAFCRLATPIFPFLDNLHLESFFFFVPNRLVWTHWENFMGEQANPGDSISYTIPQAVTPAGGYAIGSVYDYFGLPTVGQVVGGNTVSHSALPNRGYALIYNEWFRDENLVNSATFSSSDGPDTTNVYTLLRRGKRHDYFTGCLPFVQKGTAVALPLGTSAPVVGLAGQGIGFLDGGGASKAIQTTNASTAIALTANSSGTGQLRLDTVAANTHIIADLSAATGATINALRLAFQTQKLLERDARGGTRYTEIVRSHFNVVSPDARLQRPEYLGGGHTPVAINPIAQTSGSGITGSTTPMGNLAAMGTALATGHGFSQSFTEHGYIIGIVNVRADLTYQQGLRRHWSRLTRYDFYFPAFAMLGEQAVLNKEIYCDGSVNDANTFGYQERWAEYRYNPSEITGIMRSTAASTIDPWHLAQKFTALPTLNSTFIAETPPISRVVAVGAAANGQQFLADFFYECKVTRPMPLYSVPGLVDHF